MESDSAMDSDSDAEAPEKPRMSYMCCAGGARRAAALDSLPLGLSASVDLNRDPRLIGKHPRITESHSC
jgi:hypothetical protein